MGGFIQWSGCAGAWSSGGYFYFISMVNAGPVFKRRNLIDLALRKQRSRQEGNQQIPRSLCWVQRMEFETIARNDTFLEFGLRTRSLCEIDTTVAAWIWSGCGTSLSRGQSGDGAASLEPAWAQTPRACSQKQFGSVPLRGWCIRDAILDCN
jgi:hypothetical protein